MKSATRRAVMFGLSLMSIINKRGGISVPCTGRGEGHYNYNHGDVTTTGQYVLGASCSSRSSSSGPRTRTSVDLAARASGAWLFKGVLGVLWVGHSDILLLFFALISDKTRQHVEFTKTTTRTQHHQWGGSPPAGVAPPHRVQQATTTTAERQKKSSRQQHHDDAARDSIIRNHAP